MDERRKLKIVYVAALALLLILILIRFKTFEDPHGAVLMLFVALLAALGLVFDLDYDPQCCKNAGIMALISAALDFSMCIESAATGKLPAVSWHHMSEAWVKLFAHLVFACAEFAWALLCFHVCHEAEGGFWGLSDGALLATQEQARIYGAALQWTERRTPVCNGGIKEVVENFSGTAQKLPAAGP